VPAVIEGCSVDLHAFNGPADDDPTWLLACQIRFRVAESEIKTDIRSGHRSNPSQGYPAPMERWVADHPNGSSIMVRYDPADPKTATPAADYLPNAAPRTRFNLLLLLSFCGACLILLTVARRFRPANRAVARPGPG
jgi:hypothetical protein